MSGRGNKENPRKSRGDGHITEEPTLECPRTNAWSGENSVDDEPEWRSKNKRDGERNLGNTSACLRCVRMWVLLSRFADPLAHSAGDVPTVKGEVSASGSVSLVVLLTDERKDGHLCRPCACASPKPEKREPLPPLPIKEELSRSSNKKGEKLLGFRATDRRLADSSAAPGTQEDDAKGSLHGPHRGIDEEREACG